ncbi:MAG: transposase [Phycisphaeraceae bacterium]|nr:transposase [Phycisphaeraceae bacterium]
MNTLNNHPDPDAPRLDCPRCGYNVGPTSDWDPGRRSTCPECGESFVADLLSRKPVPPPISSGEVVWHILWPGIVVFVCSIVPMLSLITMPLAILILLPVTVIKTGSVCKRMAYHHPKPGSAGKRDQYAGAGVVLWLAQAALMGFAAFGGCAIALNSLNFH